jgi:hypothetical protein
MTYNDLRRTCFDVIISIRSKTKSQDKSRVLYILQCLILFRVCNETEELQLYGLLCCAI